jgi:hypothetical protein
MYDVTRPHFWANPTAIILNTRDIGLVDLPTYLYAAYNDMARCNLFGIDEVQAIQESWALLSI